MALSPIGIAMPPGSDCQGCHITEAGSLGTREIPVMAHPLFGWRDCTACHTTGSLVASAPGHSSLHKDDCLVCHQTRTETGDTSQPPLRPEHMGTDKPCVACHGVDEHAPLPEAMAGRENCWICHNGEEFTYLFEERAVREPCPEAAASPPRRRARRRGLPPDGRHAPLIRPGAGVRGGSTASGPNSASSASSVSSLVSVTTQAAPGRSAADADGDHARRADRLDPGARVLDPDAVLEPDARAARRRRGRSPGPACPSRARPGRR